MTKSSKKFWKHLKNDRPHIPHGSYAVDIGEAKKKDTRRCENAMKLGQLENRKKHLWKTERKGN